MALQAPSMEPGLMAGAESAEAWREWQVPVPVPSLANVRMHWARRHRLIKAQRQAVAAIIRHCPVTLPCVVELVRVSPHRKLDGDNLQSAFKGIRDQVASILRADDADPGIVWHYRQETGKPQHALIRIRPA